MNIHRIEAANFRCFAHATTPPLRRLNVVAGDNGTGKSTLLDAVAVALTGCCRGSWAGRSNGDLRRVGAKTPWSVGLELEDEEPIRRGEKEGPTSNRQQLIDQQIGIPAQTVLACLYAGWLTRLERKAAAKLVQDLARPEPVGIPDAIARLAAEHLGAVFSVGGRVGVEALEQLYQQAYDLRRDVKRELAGLGKLEPPVPPAGCEELAGHGADVVVESIEDVVRQLADLRRQREDLVRAQTPPPDPVAAERVELKGIRQAIVETRTALDGLPLLDAIDAKRADVERRKKDALIGNAQAEGEREALREQLARADAEASLARATLQELARDRTKCPSCASALGAPAAWSLKEKLEERAREAERAIAAAKEQLARPAQYVDVRALESEDLVLLRQSEQRRELCERMRRLEVRWKELEEAIAKAESAQKKPAKPAAGGNIAELEERIRKGESILAALQAHRGALEQHAKASTRARVLQDQVNDLERLVEAFGPNGLRTLAGGNTLDAFCARINELLAPAGFQADFGPLLALQDDPIVNGRPARMLSTAEEILFSAAFACAAASCSGLEFVAVDRFEALDVANRDRLMAMLDASGHQALVLMTPVDTDAFLEAAGRSNTSDADVLFLHVLGGTAGSTVTAPGAHEEAA
jgi:DNA repair exonuclease SbcCD ATPase subunit